ncbi:hypothetical protein Dsin_028909 [Dipteronia sinensis]|uniref:RNase H type-1 domain-containing protein n=1 Tax=Dipteronia sinensis TaxID=43782 RepID=A0AAD9ZRL2_9ROSI|nr:hypothetical protein Dsin_028909 [Dipteronia sinensis]
MEASLLVLQWTLLISGGIWFDWFDDSLKDLVVSKLLQLSRLELPFPLSLQKLWQCGMVYVAMKLGLVPFQIETDSLQVVILVNRGDHPSTDVGPVIGDILASCNLVLSWSISHVPRSPPATWWIKVNTDGTTLGSPSVGDCGGVFRTCKSFVKACFTVSVGQVFAFEVELLAVSLAINYAWNLGLIRLLDVFVKLGSAAFIRSLIWSSRSKSALFPIQLRPPPVTTGSSTTPLYPLVSNSEKHRGYPPRQDVLVYRGYPPRQDVLVYRVEPKPRYMSSPKPLKKVNPNHHQRRNLSSSRQEGCKKNLGRNRKQWEEVPNIGSVTDADTIPLASPNCESDLPSQLKHLRPTRIRGRCHITAYEAPT